MTTQPLNEESIFQVARQMYDAESRGQYLAQVCTGNEPLRKRVELLLDAQRDDGFLKSVAEPKLTTIHRRDTEQPGMHIGRYKLMEQIGEGGMGTVWVAEQSEPIRRRVALKLIKPGMDSRQVLSRFEAERQALALMDHPNIARVYDGGMTEEGRPYFVMELVHGVPITTFCDENRLAPRERLELFVYICQAIQHAHQKGIIHRDIKPTNVLVTMYDDQAVPKVIDFGVAKAMEQQLAEGTIYTQYGTVVGTFEYMSPEQAEMSALGVDTRSDIYSLGVLLYELLTGSTPLDRGRVKSAAFNELIRLIREEEPPPPSVRLSSSQTLAALAMARRTEPSRLSRLIQGEVDWIVMRCLEKDRKRRYETASSLARDVERYLRDEPVEACPPSLTYRLGKILRRHKGPAIAAALLFLALTLGIIGTTLGLLRARTERTRAIVAEQSALQEAHKAKLAATAEAAQRQRAEQNEKIAESQRDAARSTSDRLREMHYSGLMRSIADAWHAGKLTRVRDLLLASRPADGEPDLRGLEWHYWQRQLHSEFRSLRFRAGLHSPVLSPDGSRLAGMISGASARVQVRDTSSGTELFMHNLPPGLACTDIEFSYDGSRLAWVEGQDPTQLKPGAPRIAGLRLLVWDLPTRKLLLEKNGLFPVKSERPQVYFDRSASRVALIPHESEAGNGDSESPGTLTVWEVLSGNQVFRPTADQLAEFIGGDLNADGSQVMAFVSDTAERREQRLRVWDVASGTLQLNRPVQYAPHRAAKFIPGTNHLIVAQAPPNLDEMSIEVLEATEGNIIASWAEPGFAKAMRWTISSDGAKVALGSQSPAPLRVREIESGRLLLERKAHDGALSSAAFSPDGTRLLTVANGSELKEWELSNESWTAIDGRKSWQNAHAVALSPEGKQLAIQRRLPAEIEIVDVATGRQIARWSDDTPLEKKVPSVVMSPPRICFSPDGAALVALSSGVSEFNPQPESLYVTVWDVSTRRMRFSLGPEELPGGPLYFRDLQPFSPDGKFLVVVANVSDAASGLPNWEACQVLVLDAQTGQRRHTFSLPASCYALASAFSPDGRWLVGVGGKGFAAESAGQLFVWDLATGVLSAHREHGTRRLVSVAFDPGGNRLATGSLLFGGGVEGEVTLWHFPDPRPISTFAAQETSVLELTFSPDGRTLASMGASAQDITSSQPAYELQLWNVAANAELLRQRLEVGHICDLQLNQSGQLTAVLWGQRESVLKHWNAMPLPLRIEAQDVVGQLIDRHGPDHFFQAEIVKRLKENARLPQDLRRAAIELVENGPLDSEDFNYRSTLVAAWPGQSDEAYRQALRDAEQAVAMAPNNGPILNTLGLALYRVGRYEEARQTLTKSLEMNLPVDRLSDLLFLAMTCQKLNEPNEALANLDLYRLRATPTLLAQNPNREDLARLIREAEALIEPKQ